MTKLPVSLNVPQPESYDTWQEWARAFVDHHKEEHEFGEGAEEIFVASYPKTRLPRAAKDGVLIFVVDEVGGKTLAFSADGAWYRVQDRVVVS